MVTAGAPTNLQAHMHLQAAALLRSFSQNLLELLLPPHCPTCDIQVEIQGTFCPACFGALNFITEPLCRSCGLPFASTAHAGTSRTCLTCTTTPPPWREARAALLYNDGARNLVLPLKHADRQENAAFLATHMVRAGRPLLADANLLVPVPLHRWRLFRRGFNQAALLTQAIARHTHTPTCLDGLRRIRPTGVLGSLSAAQRARELHGAIAVRPGRAARIKGARIVLIDDVMTSGATASACANALLEAGAAHIDVVVASRVPDPRQA
jgi:ComF family protein